jgi:hypothetical protein
MTMTDPNLTATAVPAQETLIPATPVPGTQSHRPMPTGLAAAIYPYDADTRKRAQAAWIALGEPERQDYLEFLAGRFWPSRQRRFKIAAARLAQQNRCAQPR